MGTNFYLMTKDKNVAHQFADKAVYNDGKVVEWYNKEYEIYEEPDFHYSIHLNKLSYGWRPLFQKHKPFATFAELEKFYNDNCSPITWIEDEYGEHFSWNQYKKRILDHANQEPEPVKWIYGEDVICGFKGRKYLQTVDCDPSEADLWTPFSHIEYGETERAAQRKYEAWDAYVGWKEDYWEDPDQLIDWTVGEFS